jgi:signal transduction histidine kinase
LNGDQTIIEERFDLTMTTVPTAARYFDLFRDPSIAITRPTPAERRALHAVNQKIPLLATLEDVIDYAFETTREIFPCDRIGIAFVEENGRRVVERYTRAAYEPLLLDRGYAEDLSRSLLSVLRDMSPRIIDDLKVYAKQRPGSRSTRLLLKEGVRSSLTVPLTAEGRLVGFMFRSSRQPGVYDEHHVLLQMSMTDQISYVIEKAWRLEQLEAANRAYLEMLGFVAHELKNPVASMVTDARILADGYLGELTKEQGAKLERLISKGEYLLDLVREYLDLARVEGGELKLALSCRVLFADDVVEPALEVVRDRIAEYDMKLEVDIPDPLRVVVDCDPSLLKIVLVNLLANAAKYGRAGGTIRLAVTSTRSRLKVSVWNEGPGFKPSQKAQLFRKFSRLDTPALSGRRGTGLGLYNAWRIVRLHGGRIKADSKLGEWVEMSFEIPQPLCTPDGVPPSNGVIP